MKNICAIASILLFTACSNKEKDNETVTKSDLAKIKWIIGNWRGSGTEKPFYEMYEMPNDSTIQITGYEWDGKDTSHTDISYIT